MRIGNRQAKKKRKEKRKQLEYIVQSEHREAINNFDSTQI